MIKTLKITSIAVAILVAGCVLFLLIFGLRDNQQIEQFLNSPSAIEKFKDKASESTKPQDTIPPLVKQARGFALRIDPPPPPKPPEPPKPKAVAKQPTAPKRPVPAPKTTVSAKFSLLGTCRYENAPEKSLAMLKTVAEGNKWLRQGEQIGHLTINEIKDGSIVLYKDGKKNSEIFVPIQETKSLLKSEAGKIPKNRQTSVSITEPAVTSDTSIPETIPATTDIPSPSIPENSSRIPVAPGRRISTTQLRRPTSPEPTPEQKKQTIEDSISSIKKIMSNPNDALSDEEKIQEQKAWQQFLDVLQKEKQAIEETEKDKGSPKATQKK
jgi:hypothetical protein